MQGEGGWVQMAENVWRTRTVVESCESAGKGSTPKQVLTSAAVILSALLRPRRSSLQNACVCVLFWMLTHQLASVSHTNSVKSLRRHRQGLIGALQATESSTELKAMLRWCDAQQWHRVWDRNVLSSARILLFESSSPCIAARTNRVSAASSRRGRVAVEVNTDLPIHMLI